MAAPKADKNKPLAKAPKHPGGRPTKLTTGLIERANEYIESIWMKEGSVIPTVEGLALYLGTSRRNIYQWAEDIEQFSHTLEWLQALQSRVLQDKGLTGEFNSNITKLILSAKHQFVERQDVTTDGKALPTPILGGVTKDGDE